MTNRCLGRIIVGRVVEDESMTPLVSGALYTATPCAKKKKKCIVLLAGVLSMKKTNTSISVAYVKMQITQSHPYNETARSLIMVDKVCDTSTRNEH